MDFQVTGGHSSFWKLVVLGNVYWTFNLIQGIRLFGTLKMFYHPKGTEGGPIVFTYALSPEGNRRRSNCFYLCLIPRRDSAKQILKVVQLFLLMSYFVLGKVKWTFNLQKILCLFETFKMFYPPKVTEGGPIVFTYVLLS